MDRVYFANLAPNEIASNLYDKVNSYYEEVDGNGRLGLWRKAHREYFAMDENGRHEASAIRRGGEQGELSMLKANHLRNLLQHLLVLVTQQRPAFECRAVNTDYRSMVQTMLGTNVLDYYLRVKRLDRLYRQAAEVAIVYSEAYVEVDWDQDAGDDVAADPETGERVRAGEIATRVYEPIDVIRRCMARADGRQEWFILRRWENRHELAARHPDHAEYILAYSEDTPDNRLYYSGYLPKDQKDEDLIPVYTLYHERTAACPTGRKVRFLGSEAVLEYGPLESEVMPVFPMVPSYQHGTSFGYTVAFDLLVVQESIDLLYSTILSNQATFGVQNIWMKPGSNLIESQLGGGLNILESAEKPEAINLTHTPPEIFNFLKGLEQLGEVISGVNSVARGQPEASLKSGSALALVASQAVQFSNGLQASYIQLLEDTGTCILKTLQQRASLPRTAAIAGKSNRSYVKEFVGDDLSAINRVIVDVGNPVSRTVSGRIQMAQDLLQAQVIKSPEQYIRVIETGSTEPLIDEQKSEQMLIDAENEALREGREVMVVAVDIHPDHIKCHKKVLGDPEARRDPELVARTLAHIQEHIEQLRTQDPALLNVLGMQAIQMNPAGQPTTGPQGQNAPQPNEQPQPGEQPSPGQQVPAPNGATPEMADAMPRMPEPAQA